jgi:hypothetical protein
LQSPIFCFFALEFPETLTVDTFILMDPAGFEASFNFFNFANFFSTSSLYCLLYGDPVKVSDVELRRFVALAEQEYGIGLISVTEILLTHLGVLGMMTSHAELLDE